MSRRTGCPENAGAARTGDGAECPPDQTCQPSSTAAPSESEEELLEEDEAMVDAPGALRVRESLQQGSGSASVRASAVAGHPGEEN